MISMRLFLPFSAFVLAAGMIACNEDMSGIGGSITTGEATIYIDTMTYDLQAHAIDNKSFDSRSGSMLLGNLDVPEYGSLNCSFVTRMMCAATLPVGIDTVPLERIDSCKLMLLVDKAGIAGDSLAPQQMTIYRLNKQLPSDINNEFNPEGYYDPSDILSRKNYTLTQRALSDSTFIADYPNVYIVLETKLPQEMAKDVVEKYRTEPSIFAWPQSFAQYFPGMYVEPSFGKGCVASIYRIRFVIYYHNLITTTSTVDGETVTKTTKKTIDIPIFTTAPEVLSSNNVTYKVSDYIRDLIENEGKTVITTPGGYTTRFTFPAREIIQDYRDKEHNLSIISNLLMNIPAESMTNDYGIGVVPTLLMIKTSEVDEFFRENKLADNKTSFTAAYDSTNKRYQFNALREYLLSLLAKDVITDDDLDFSLIPVYLQTEQNYNSYYGTSSSTVTGVVPYTIRPTMTMLDMDKAQVVFSFSSQIVK